MRADETNDICQSIEEVCDFVLAQAESCRRSGDLERAAQLLTQSREVGYPDAVQAKDTKDSTTRDRETRDEGADVCAMLERAMEFTLERVGECRRRENVGNARQLLKSTRGLKALQEVWRD